MAATFYIGNINFLLELVRNNADPTVIPGIVALGMAPGPRPADRCAVRMGGPPKKNIEYSPTRGAQIHSEIRKSPLFTWAVELKAGIIRRRNISCRGFRYKPLPAYNVENNSAVGK